MEFKVFKKKKKKVKLQEEKYTCIKGSFLIKTVKK
jgi:hypothetical protein